MFFNFFNNKFLNPVWKYRFEKVSDKAIIPSYATSKSSGLDLNSIEDVVIQPREIALIRTGLTLKFFMLKEKFFRYLNLFYRPYNFRPYMMIAGRSGLVKKGIILTHNGIIDCDFKGEILIALINISDDPYEIKAGDRIAQGLIHVVIPQSFEDNIELDIYKEVETNRGKGGFGSTGK